MALGKNKRIHFVGIGGIGMSGIALVLLEMGYKVSGSDLETNDLTRKIETLGGRVFKGHFRENLSDDVGVLVYSSAVAKDNPEMAEARRRGLKILHRSEALAKIFNKKKGIAVTGTHGKTTTTSLIAVMLENLRQDPTVIIGGEVDRFGGNAKLGKGPFAVVEADESDSSFLNLRPQYEVMTNIELEHVDHFRTLAASKSSYRDFAARLKRSGFIIYNGDDKNLRGVLKDLSKKSSSYGFSAGCDMRAEDIRTEGGLTSFVCVHKNKRLGTVKLKVPGRHNVQNAMAAILLGLRLGFKFKEIVSAIREFSGVKRRLQVRFDKDVMLVDDYAHHPTEIRAVLDACRSWNRKRIVAVFQPHRYTRTKFLADDFGRCFSGADKLILTDIYAASEAPLKGVSIRNIYDRVRTNGLRDCVILKKDQIPDHVMKIKNKGDILLVMGAGDIKKVADRICDRLLLDSRVDPGVSEGLRKTAKGNVRTKEVLANHTSFKIGGPADFWVEPADERDLKRLLVFAGERNVPIFVIGNGSNLLVNDDGFRGIVVKFSSPRFKKIQFRGETVTVGSGYALARLVRLCNDKDLGGLESLVGIPGTVGGAIYMNAGGYTNPIYKNISDLVTYVRVMDYGGRIRTLKRKDIGFGYRTSGLEGYVILEAALKLKKALSGLLRSSSAKFLKMKSSKHPLDLPSAGCVFKNPRDFQFSCGQMIDMLGLKGKRIGGAEVSTKHANFVVNRGAATCKDVLGLMDIIRTRVRDSYGVELETEVKIV